MKYKEKIDVFCVGETLVDCIGHQMNATIEKTEDYHRYLGGSPANVAMNLARLGANVELASTVGEDGFGIYILDQLKENRVSVAYVRQDAVQPTSVIFISKTKGTPDFIPFRKADMMITENQIPTEALEQTQIFHTTAFALSKNPSRNTILAKAKEAHELGCILSIDINYSQRIWPDRLKAMKTIKTYCQYDPLIKISKDDVERLFEEHLSYEEIFTFFHDHLNVSIVCLTLGSKGVTLSRKHKTPITLPAEKVKDIMDVTGAGDAFWSGFLFAYLKEFPIERSLKMALSLAAIKLQSIGSLPKNRDILSELLRIT